MRGLEKNYMKRDKYIYRQIDIRTSRLYDRIGPLGRFNENWPAFSCVGSLNEDHGTAYGGLVLLYPFITSLGNVTLMEVSLGLAINLATKAVHKS